MFELKNYNIRLDCQYKTVEGGVIQKEAIIPITTSSREKAVEIAIEKAKKQLREFDYIDKSSISVEKKKREIKKRKLV